MKEFIEIPADHRSISIRKKICGVAFNDVGYQVQPLINGRQLKCPFYEKWKGMIRRCYETSPPRKNNRYFDCVVSEEWKYLSVFRAWMIKQDWEDRELDKDILIPGNKLYSKDTCIFISHKINSLLLASNRSRGDLPIGVTLKKSNGWYSARARHNNKTVFLGDYKDVETASLSYRNFKSSHIIKIAQQQSDLILKDSLMLHAEIVRLGK